MSDLPSVGLVLTRAPGEAGAQELLDLASEAAERGHEVLLYLLDEGVRHLHGEALQKAADLQVKLYCCAFGAQRRGLEPDARVVSAGLYVLASLVAGSDRFLSV